MRSVGVIGANGQVGFEVCLYLKYQMGVRPIAICRNALSSVLLRRYEIECRHGLVSNPEEVKELIKGIDVLVDFSLPSGDTFNDIINAYKTNIDNVMKNMPQGGSYIFISTIMAFGQDDSRMKLKNYLFPGTVYGKTKRKIEQYVISNGIKRKIPVYIFRVGQVHGQFQSVSSSFNKWVNDGWYNKIMVPNEAAYSVFTVEIAKAIQLAGNSALISGAYSLVTTPDIKWKALFEYYKKDKNDLLILESDPNSKVSFPRSIINKVVSFLKEKIIDKKEFLRANLLIYFPGFEQKLIFKNHVDTAKGQVSQLQNKSVLSPQFFRGKLPGARIEQLETQLKTVQEAALQLENTVRTLENKNLIV